MPSWDLGRPVTRYTGLCCPRPSSAQKENCNPTQMDLAGLSAERLDSLTHKETNNRPSHLSITLPFHPNPGPQRGKTNKTTTTNAGNCTRAVPQNEADCSNFWAVPCTSSQNTDYRAGDTARTLSQAAPHPGWC